MRKHIILLVTLLFFIVGCATTIRPTYVDPTGRQLPVPHYILQDMSGEIMFTFYYTAFKSKKDLDGTILRIPTYLSLSSLHKIKLSEYELITLTIEVMNPQRMEYRLWGQYISISKTENKIIVSNMLGKSNTSYRYYTFRLPFSDSIKEVIYGVSVYNKDGNHMMNIGDFHYMLIK